MSEGSTTNDTAAESPAPPPAPKPEAKTATATNSSVIGDEKVKVHFVAVGAAPIMKKKKFLIAADQRFSSVITFLRKMLKMNTNNNNGNSSGNNNSGSSLFLYCNSAFVPGPDELVGDLRDCFNIGGELVIHYSLQEAWG